jgi:hypothetical protein
MATKILNNPELETTRRQYETDCFSMFTCVGGRKIRNYFMTLLRRLDKDCSRAAALRAFASYFKSYRRARSSNGAHGEASDTAVRESVWCAAMNLKPYQRYEIDDDKMDELWEEHAC